MSSGVEAARSSRPHLQRNGCRSERRHRGSRGRRRIRRGRARGQPFRPWPFRCSVGGCSRRYGIVRYRSWAVRASRARASSLVSTGRGSRSDGGRSPRGPGRHRRRCRSPQRRGCCPRTPDPGGTGVDSVVHPGSGLASVPVLGVWSLHRGTTGGAHRHLGVGVARRTHCRPRSRCSLLVSLVPPPSQPRARVTGSSKAAAGIGGPRRSRGWNLTGNPTTEGQGMA